LQDTAFPFFAAAILILVFGPGRYSLDGIFRRCRGTGNRSG